MFYQTPWYFRYDTLYNNYANKRSSNIQCSFILFKKIKKIIHEECSFLLIYTVKLTLKVCIGIQNHHKSLKKIDELNCPFFMHVRLNKDTKCTSMRINENL